MIDIKVTEGELRTIITALEIIGNARANVLKEISQDSYKDKDGIKPEKRDIDTEKNNVQKIFDLTQRLSETHLNSKK